MSFFIEKVVEGFTDSELADGLIRLGDRYIAQGNTVAGYTMKRASVRLRELMGEEVICSEADNCC